MVPPFDNTGDEFPDFENMSPEEQMAWLESLAKRQGANQSEFTTAADLDIPIPENAVVDEPGYVPYSETTRASAPTEEPEPEAELEPEPVISESTDEVVEDPMQ
jgi:hypothetical protein